MTLLELVGQLSNYNFSRWILLHGVGYPGKENKGRTAAVSILMGKLLGM
jgi:hypothetical protein